MSECLVVIWSSADPEVAHNMVFMFTYSPAGVVDHWKQEMEGKLK